MKTKYWIELTKVEVDHLNSLIKLNEEEGSYTPPKNQYWSRSARITFRGYEYVKPLFVRWWYNYCT